MPDGDIEPPNAFDDSLAMIPEKDNAPLFDFAVFFSGVPANDNVPAIDCVYCCDVR